MHKNATTVFKYSPIFIFYFLMACAHIVHAQICLVLVVRNDEMVIERMLNSVKDVIHSICVCNVGSQDNTLSLLHAFTLETGIPITVVHAENDQHNYWTCAVQAAQSMLEQTKNDADDYLLVVESGKWVTGASILPHVSLKADAYSCVNKKQSLGYSKKNLHLLKASMQWNNQGLIDPEWVSSGSLCVEELDGFEIEEIEETDYVKKSVLKTVDSLKGNSDPKSLLHLALAHKALQKQEIAIQLFKNHIERESDREAAWLSHYMIGECYEALKEWELALDWYLQAYQYDPNRGEPLYRLAVHYRHKGDNHIAYLFAKQGTRVDISKNQKIKPIPSLCSFQFDEELSITAYYTKYMHEGDAALNDLLLRKEVPWHIRDQAYKNLLFYCPRLQEKRSIPIHFDLPLIFQESEEHYYPMNPSILKTENGYRVICRTVNYTQSGAKHFHTNDPNGIFRTRNFLLDYDGHFHLQSQHEIIEDLPRKRIQSFNLEGLDDCRIFALDNAVWFSCTTGDTNPYGTFQISLCKLRETLNDQNVKVEKLIPLMGPDPYRCEKNWLPFVQDGRIHFIYSYDPFIVFSPDIKTGQCQRSIQYEPSYDFSHFRGSAGPIAFDDGYLLLVHEVVLQSDLSRCYVHRFLFLDTNFKVIKITKPFYFQHHGVEYCCSMTINHEADELILPLGLEDKEAHLYFFDCDSIRSLLYPLKGHDPHVFST